MIVLHEVFVLQSSQLAEVRQALFDQVLQVPIGEAAVPRTEFAELRESVQLLCRWVRGSLRQIQNAEARDSEQGFPVASGDTPRHQI